MTARPVPPVAPRTMTFMRHLRRSRRSGVPMRPTDGARAFYPAPARGTRASTGGPLSSSEAGGAIVAPGPRIRGCRGKQDGQRALCCRLAEREARASGGERKRALGRGRSRPGALVMMSVREPPAGMGGVADQPPGIGIAAALQLQREDQHRQLRLRIGPASAHKSPHALKVVEGDGALPGRQAAPRSPRGAWRPVAATATAVRSARNGPGNWCRIADRSHLFVSCRRGGAITARVVDQQVDALVGGPADGPRRPGHRPQGREIEFLEARPWRPGCTVRIRSSAANPLVSLRLASTVSAPAWARASTIS